MNQQLLEKYLWGAATALRGTIDAGDYKQYMVFLAMPAGTLQPSSTPIALW